MLIRQVQGEIASTPGLQAGGVRLLDESAAEKAGPKSADAGGRHNGRLRTTPVGPLVVMGAQMVVAFGMTCLGMLLLVLAGKLVYHVRFKGNALSNIGGFILGKLSFFGIGFVLAGVLPNARTAQVVAMVLLYPKRILSGAAWPRELMPSAVQKISAFLPLTYVVNLLRGLWIGEAWSQHWLDVGVLAGIAISVKTFRWE